MVADSAAPLWQRLLARPRLLHRVASAMVLIAALTTAVDSYIRSTPAGPRPDVVILTYLFDLIAWSIVIVAALAEAFVAGLSAPRLRAGGRPHYLIVFVVGFLLASLVLSAQLYFAAETRELTLAGRIVKAGAAGMLPLLVAVALTAGSTLVWMTQLRPRLEARLEAEIRAFESQRGAVSAPSTAGARESAARTAPSDTPAQR